MKCVLMAVQVQKTDLNEGFEFETKICLKACLKIFLSPELLGSVA